MPLFRRSKEIKKSLDSELYFVDKGTESNEPVVCEDEKIISKAAENITEDQALERLVFGGEDDVEEELENFVKTSKKRTKSQKSHISKVVKWVDPNDDSDLMKNLTELPSWATKKFQGSDSEVDEDDEDDRLLKSTGNFLSVDKRLRSQEISMNKCKDICKIQGKVRALEFLPNESVALVGGADSKLRLFQIDGKKNLEIETKPVWIENSPIFTAHFSVDGQSVVMGSQRHKSLYCYNIGRNVVEYRIQGLDYFKNTSSFVMSPDGRYIALLGLYGYVHLLSAKTKEPIESLKAEGDQIEAVAFTHDGSKLLTHGGDGVVNVWDMRHAPKRCLHSFVDDGCIKGSSLAVSPNDRYIAAGSDDGTVNIYDQSCLLQPKNQTGYDLARPEPIKKVFNLTQRCTQISFNHSNEILAISSNMTEESAVKLVHLDSMTVFANFPRKNDYLHIPYVVSFSPNSGYMAVGNNKGDAMLFRLKHFSDF